MRVLIVEDDEMLANTLRWIAEELGDEACVCHTGGEAIDVAHATRPDLVLVDMDLPDMDGVDVCRSVCSDADTRSATVVAHTAFSDPEMRQKAKSAGCHDFFVKGADFPNLMALFSTMHVRLAVQ
jgi:two-component system, cell cycle response regulator DivK